LKGKIIRSFKSLLPVAPNRNRDCNSCGACCEIDFKCPFLRYDETTQKSRCSIYKFRPIGCRKYPRVSKELVTPEKCGYYFVDLENVELKSIK